MDKLMKRKYTEGEIKNLEGVCYLFLVVSTLISVISALISFIILIVVLPSLLTTRDIGYSLRISPLIAFIWFLISVICFEFLININFDGLNFLRERNNKIDEEEKARQQALLLEVEERNRAELQIWVSE